MLAIKIKTKVSHPPELWSKPHREKSMGKQEATHGPDVPRRERGRGLDMPTPAPGTCFWPVPSSSMPCWAAMAVEVCRVAASKGTLSTLAMWLER